MDWDTVSKRTWYKIDESGYLRLLQRFRQVDVYRGALVLYPIRL